MIWAQLKALTYMTLVLQIAEIRGFLKGGVLGVYTGRKRRFIARRITGVQPEGHAVKSLPGTE